MALLSLKETYPDYRKSFSEDSLSHLDDYSVYVDENNKAGSVDDGLFDSVTGRFRYLVVDTGPWIFGKKVLLPIGKADFDIDNRRVYARGLTKEQVERLPEYKNGEIDYDYEESVRGIYREAPVETDVPVEGRAATSAYSRENYSYDAEPGLYQARGMANEKHPFASMKNV